MARQSNTVDLEMLKRQKQWLVEAGAQLEQAGLLVDSDDHLHGLLSLLDYIQDQLEDNGYVRLVELE